MVVHNAAHHAMARAAASRALATRAHLTFDAAFVTRAITSKIEVRAKASRAAIGKRVSRRDRSSREMRKHHAGSVRRCARPRTASCGSITARVQVTGPKVDGLAEPIACRRGETIPHP
jgi:hypothetical protein